MENRSKEMDLEQKRLVAEQTRAETELTQTMTSILKDGFPLSEIDEVDIERRIRSRLIPPLRALGDTGIHGLDTFD